MRSIFAGLALAVCTAAAPVPQSLVIDLTLTPRAAAKLEQLGQSITIAAMYGGEATAAHRRDADDMGEIWLGMDRKTVTGRTQQVVMTVRTLRRDRMSWVVEPKLLINVFSARRKARDNILNCGIYDDPLAAAADKPVAITCDLSSLV